MDFSLSELQSMKTLCVGQSCNLKYEKDGVRVWLSRCTIEDGEHFNNKITIEKLIDGYWKTVKEYEGF